jgi:hypothetical protein
MWMEGVGSWSRALARLAQTDWMPNKHAHKIRFVERWSHLLSMTPTMDIAALQEANKAHRKCVCVCGGGGGCLLPRDAA